MQNNNNAFDSNISSALSSSLEHITPSEALDDSVIDEVHQMSTRHAVASASQGRFYSRRQFVLATAGVLGGFVAAGFGIKALTSGLLPANVGTEGVDGIPVTEAGAQRGHRFGLSIALADDGTEPEPGTFIPIKTTDEGLICVNDNTMPLKSFKMNLKVVGDDIKQVTYTVLAAPSYVPLTSIFSQPPIDSDSSVPRVCFDVAQYTDKTTEVQLENGSSFNLTTSEGEMSSERVTSFTVDYSNPSSSDFQTMDTHRFLYVTAFEEFYAHTNDQLWLWFKALTDPQQNSGLSHEEMDEYIELYRTYNAAYEEKASNIDTFIAWQRSNYIAGYEAVAEALSNTLFQIEVLFNDNTTETRQWQLLPIDNFSDALSERFDAMNNACIAFYEFAGFPRTLDDLYSERFEEVPDGSEHSFKIRFPYHQWSMNAVPILDFDPRLKDPLFQIAEVIA